MNILSICNDGDVLSVIRILRIVIRIIKILVPIILIISLSIEFMSAVTSSDQDSLKKAGASAVRKAVAAILIFLIPNIVGIIVNIANASMEYDSCLKNATKENITAAYVNTAQKVSDYAKKAQTRSSYQLALSAAYKINDKEVRQKFIDELADVKIIIEAREAVEKVRKSLRESEYEKAKKAVEKIKDSSVKEELNKELEKINQEIIESKKSSYGNIVSGYLWPCKATYITSRYGYRIHPIFGTSRLHAGTDIGASYGSEIWAAMSGTVTLAGWNGGYGNCVMIRHDNGQTTLYAHQSSIAVSVGQRVSQGQVIGYVGSTGNSTGPHLHFEVRDTASGQTMDPQSFTYSYK